MIQLPSSKTAEEAAVTILSDCPEAWVKLRWSADLFHHPTTRCAFEIMEAMRSKGEPVSKMGIIAGMESQSTDSEKMREVILAINSDAIPTFDFAKSYWQKLSDILTRRKAIILASEGAEKIAAGEMGPTELSSRLAEVVTVQSTETKTFKEHIGEFIDAIEGKTPVESFGFGFPALDLKVQLKRGEVAVVGGETGGGKSIVLLQAALDAANAGKRVLIASMEMPGKQVIARMISNSLGFCVKQGMTFTRHQFARLNPEVCRLSKLPINIVCGSDIDDILREASAFNADLLVVDYLQLLTTKGKSDTRELQVSEVARKLKQAAMANNYATITASQLNDDGRLRESRAIGQHADYVISITGEGFFLSKVRDGERKITIPARMVGHLSRFEAA